MITIAKTLKEIELVNKEKSDLEQAPKYDDNKARFDLIPPYPLWELAKVYNIGAGIEYPEHSWEKGISYSRIYAALQRHLNSFWAGERSDPKDGLHHLAHAVWNCFALMEYEINRPEFDDRTFSIPDGFKRTFEKKDMAVLEQVEKSKCIDCPFGPNTALPSLGACINGDCLATNGEKL